MFCTLLTRKYVAETLLHFLVGVQVVILSLLYVPATCPYV